MLQNVYKLHSHVMGRMVNRVWSLRVAWAHIHILELQALRHCWVFFQGQHVLVKMDNSTVVAYINYQGTTYTLQLHRLAHKMILWSSISLLSLCATHMPGILNGMEGSPAASGTDMAENWSSRHRSLRLARKHSLLTVFLPVRHECTIGDGCFSPPMAQGSLCFPTTYPDIPDTGQSEGSGCRTDFDNSSLATQALDCKNDPTPM